MERLAKLRAHRGSSEISREIRTNGVPEHVGQGSAC